MKLHFRAFIALPITIYFLFSSSSVAQECSALDPIATPPCEDQSEPGVAPVYAQVSQFVANPIDAISGNKFQRTTDFKSLGSELRFTRFYNTYQSEINLGLGNGWRHSYHVQLLRESEQQLSIVQADGRKIDFKLVGKANAQHVYIPLHARDGFLVVHGNPVWHLPDGRRLSFNGSFLNAISYANGNHLQLNYIDFRLDRVTDSYGRTLQFEYAVAASRSTDLNVDSDSDGDGDGKNKHYATYLKSLVLPNGERVEYGYDDLLNLIDKNDLSGVTHRYRYENATLPRFLTAWNTSDASVDKSWVYDDSKRAVQFADRVRHERVSLQYSNNHLLDDQGETAVKFNDTVLKTYHWKKDSAETSAYIYQLDEKGCVDCPVKSFQYNPSLVLPEKDVDVLLSLREQWVSDQALSAEDFSAGFSAKQLVLKALQSNEEDYFGAAMEKLVAAYQPAASSLGGRIHGEDSGFTQHFEILADKDGQVTEIRTQNLSVRMLKTNWLAGRLVQCGKTTIADTSTDENLGLNTDPNTCLENLLFMMDLISKLEDKVSINSTAFEPANGGGSDREDSTVIVEQRRKSKSVVVGEEPCKKNPFDSCNQLYRNFELALMSECAYQLIKQFCGLNWEAVDMEMMGIDEHEYQDAVYSASLFYNPFKDEYVLAYRGTDNLSDIPTNLLQAGGMSVSQYQKAVSLAEKVSAAVGSARLTFTGHSLGGGLATAAAAKVHELAVVFNPAALQKWTASKLGLDDEFANNWVQVTTMKDDIVTLAQKPKLLPVAPFFFPLRPAPGVHTVLPKPEKAWVDAEKERFPLGTPREKLVMHSIKAVLKSVEEILTRQCQLVPSREWY